MLGYEELNLTLQTNAPIITQGSANLINANACDVAVGNVLIDNALWKILDSIRSSTAGAKQFQKMLQERWAFLERAPTTVRNPAAYM